MKFLLALTLTLLVSRSQAAALKTDLKYDSNVTPAVKTQMEGDLAFVNSIKGAKTSALYTKIFGAMDGATLSTWFSSRITAVGYSETQDGAVAYVMMFMPWKMWLTNNFVQFSHPQISRLMVVYHEARHSEVKNGNWAHADCPTPFKNDKGEDMKSIWTGRLLQGQPACDNSPFGSYGSSTILLKNVAMNCESCSEKVKMDADIYANDQMGRITNAAAREEMLKDFSVQ